MALDDDAFTRALLMAGLGMMGAPNAWQGISRGGMFGLQGYDQAVENKRKAADDLTAQELKKLQVAQAQLAIDKQTKLAALYGGGQQPQAPQGPRPSMMDAPGWASSPMAQRPQQAPAQQGESVGQMLLKAGFVKEAEEWAKAQTALGGEVFNEVHVGKDGRPYLLNKNGKQQFLDQSAAPRDKLVAHNTGNALQFTTEFDTKPMGSLAVNMSPAERDASARGWGNLGLEQKKFNRGDLRDVPMPDGSTGIGYVTPGGFQQIPGTGTKEKERPATIQMALANNAVMLDKIDRAELAVQNYPQAFGAKNYMGDAIRQRTDSEGVPARAVVSDIGSQVLHDRSGASITASEAPRLQPFVPLPTDRADVIADKLKNFRREFTVMRQELEGGKPLAQAVGRKVATENVSGAAVEAELRRRGIKP